MKLRRIITVLSLATVGSTIFFVAFADHEERLPQRYYSLDKSKPWNELAGTLDPQMSDGEYNQMRTRYFYDVVAPQLSDKSETFGAYREFMRLTDRPWQWNRRSSRGEPPGIIKVAFLISTLYLTVALLLWIWGRVLRPAGQIARDDGLAGIAQVVLHGRKSKGNKAEN
jgi:hypothetical protein